VPGEHSQVWGHSSGSFGCIVLVVFRVSRDWLSLTLTSLVPWLSYVLGFVFSVLVVEIPDF
jgi:hypothetical protein